MEETLWIITPQAIGQYADATENHDPVFCERESARALGLDNVMAPTGFFAQYQTFLTAADRVPRGGMHTRQSLSVLRPVLAGDHVTARTEARRETDAKGRTLLVYRTDFVNQRGETVCRGEMTNLLPAPQRKEE